MKQDYYIIQSGRLTRHENTIYFENENTKRILPIQKIDSIYAYGMLSLSSGVIQYLCKGQVPVHFFNYYGFYTGTMYPRERLVSGNVVVNQAKAYLDVDDRLYFARKFVEAAAKNILRNIEYYTKSKPELKEYNDKIRKIITGLDNTSNIPEIMHIEGAVREKYYNCIDELMPKGYRIIKRTRQPPENRMNTLISFGNSLVYTTVLSEIYNTQLNPTISYLHEPYERRFSLSLDISEVFKPILADRVIFKLVNKKMLDDSCFREEMADVMLTDKGRKLFLTEYNDRLQTTIKHKSLGRNVSYKRLIRLECYKLIKHLLGEKKYKPLVMWW